MRSCTYQGTNDDTKHQRFTQYTELLLQSLGIDIQFRETRDTVEQPVDGDGKRGKTLTERLRNRDSLHILVVALETVGCQVSHHQRDDIAADGSEIAPKQALVHHEISHGTNEGKMPVVPQVDIHRAGTLRYQQQEIDTQANGDNQCTHRCIVSHSGSSRPSHVKNLQVQVEDLGDGIQRGIEIGCQQSRHDAQSNKTDTHIKTTLKRLAELHADAQADDSEEDRHHDRRS